MKFIVASLLSLLSISAYALTEVECSGRSGQTSIVLGIEESFPSQSPRRSYVRAESPAGGQVRNFIVMGRGAFGNRVRFDAPGFDLEVDFWPDQRPQWARTYRGNFSSNDMNIPFTMMWCRFPNIRP